MCRRWFAWLGFAAMAVAVLFIAGDPASAQRFGGRGGCWFVVKAKGESEFQAPPSAFPEQPAQPIRQLAPRSASDERRLTDRLTFTSCR